MPFLRMAPPLAFGHLMTTEQFLIDRLCAESSRFWRQSIGPRSDERTVWLDTTCRSNRNTTAG